VTVIEIRLDLVIDAPAERVFDLLADVRNAPRWNSAAKSVVLPPGPKIGEGTTFTGRYGKGIGRVQIRIVRFERPSRIAFRAEAWTLTNDLDATLTAEGAATRFTATARVEPRGVGRLLAPLMRVGLRRDVPRSFVEFKRFVEEHAPPAETRAAPRAG
jgi:uncharacterized protein YndB with AHSA1/START domain